MLIVEKPVLLEKVGGDLGCIVFKVYLFSLSVFQVDIPLSKIRQVDILVVVRNTMLYGALVIQPPLKECNRIHELTSCDKLFENMELDYIRYFQNLLAYFLGGFVTDLNRLGSYFLQKSFPIPKQHQHFGFLRSDRLPEFGLNFLGGLGEVMELGQEHLFLHENSKEVPSFLVPYFILGMAF